jgi:hypothetical protein
LPLVAGIPYTSLVSQDTTAHNMYVFLKMGVSKNGSVDQ